MVYVWLMFIILMIVLSVWKAFQLNPLLSKSLYHLWVSSLLSGASFWLCWLFLTLLAVCSSYFWFRCTKTGPRQFKLLNQCTVKVKNEILFWVGHYEFVGGLEACTYWGECVLCSNLKQRANWYLFTDYFPFRK